MDLIVGIAHVQKNLHNCSESQLSLQDVTLMRSIGLPQDVKSFTESIVEKVLLNSSLVKIQSRSATVDELLLCHTKEYINLLTTTTNRKNHLQQCSPMWLIQDKVEDDPGNDRVIDGIGVHICGHSFDVAIATTGGILNLIDSIMRNEIHVGWLLGGIGDHHAGTCYVIYLQKSFCNMSYLKAQVMVWDII